MKALLVDLETQWRGGQNQALLLLKGLRARGHTAELVSVAGSALEERALTSDICVHPADRFLKTAQAALEIRRLVNSAKFDVVHANEPHALTAAWLARAHSHVPLIASRRVGYPLSKSWLARRRYQAATKIVAISQWSAKQAIDSGAPSSKLTVVHEGVELPALSSPEARQAARAHWNVPENAPLLGCVGVLSPDKGQEWLIRALALVRREFPDCKLLLAGDGPCRAKLEQLAAEMGLGDAVLFPGFVKNVESVYSALDLFLLPSFFEALSNALMSAMAYGIPSIAFRLGGPAEIIEDLVSGFLVEPAQDDALANAISKVLGDRALAQRLGQQGRNRIERTFSAEQMVRGILSVYDQALRR